MFGKREITVKLGKKEKDDDTFVEEIEDDRLIEEKIAAVLNVLGKAAVKVALVGGVYILLDTHRQVAIARATNPR